MMPLQQGMERKRRQQRRTLLCAALLQCTQGLRQMTVGNLLKSPTSLAIPRMRRSCRTPKLTSRRLSCHASAMYVHGSRALTWRPRPTLLQGKREQDPLPHAFPSWQGKAHFLMETRDITRTFCRDSTPTSPQDSHEIPTSCCRLQVDLEPRHG